ncbi:unnamed protein product [Oikopleura dioica]|uniref:Uncharacterized protein n=1 Tax=Oikopleura dioica TaxID=34765 RepID=E4Y2S7_OIKDI|nr:unnamed protein product [Oikopleura dioica]
MGSGSSLLGALALPEHRTLSNLADKQLISAISRDSNYGRRLQSIRSSYFLLDHDITGAHVHHQCMCSETAKNPLEEICARTFVRDLSKRRKAVLERFAVYQREICKENAFEYL